MLKLLFKSEDTLNIQPYHTIPYHTIPYHTIPYHTIPYQPYHTIPYHTIPYHTIPYHTIPYHTIPYQPYHTMPSMPCRAIQLINYQRFKSRLVPSHLGGVIGFERVKRGTRGVIGRQAGSLSFQIKTNSERWVYLRV